MHTCMQVVLLLLVSLSALPMVAHDAYNVRAHREEMRARLLQHL